MPRRAHILLPEELLREIDSLVGPRGRSAFLVETARNEVRRHRLLQFLQSNDPAWKDKDHPELAGGSSAWVRTLRAESEVSRGGKNARQGGRQGKTRPRN
jgi:hypothetical protein